MLIVKCLLFNPSFCNKVRTLLTPWGRVSCISKTACFLANYAPLSLQPGRNVEPYGSKRISFAKCGMVWDKIWTQAADFSLSQSEAFLPLSSECSDIARERDIILPKKGKCMCVLEALHSDIWLLALGLCLGDPVLCS